MLKNTNFSSTLVYDCLDEIQGDILVLEKIEFFGSLEKIILGINEFSFQGRNSLCQITELSTQKVFWILVSNSKGDIEEWGKNFLSKY